MKSLVYSHIYYIYISHVHMHNNIILISTFISALSIHTQQDQVISEIEKHGAGQSKSDEMTLCYLKALNNMFERGVLCKEHISSTNQAVLARMEKGFNFFSKWRKHVIDQGDLNIDKHTAFL